MNHYHAWYIYYCIRFHKCHQDPSKNQRHLICKRWPSFWGAQCTFFLFTDSYSIMQLQWQRHQWNAEAHFPSFPIRHPYDCMDKKQIVIIMEQNTLSHFSSDYILRWMTMKTNYAWWIYYCIRFYKSHQDPTNSQWHLICKRWGLLLLTGTVMLFPFDWFLQWIAIAMMEAQVKCDCIDGGIFSHIPNEISIYTTLLSELKVWFLLHGWLQMGQVDIITKVWYEKCFSSKSDTCMDINWFPIMNLFLVLQLSYKNMLHF